MAASHTGKLGRVVRRLVDRLGLRPLGFAAFVLSLLAVVQLGAGAARHHELRALGYAEAIDHPSPLRSYAAEVFVSPGTRVEAGDALLRLAAEPFEKRLRVLEHEIEVAKAEAALEAARLAAQEELWLDPELRSRRGQPSLRSQMRARNKAQRDALSDERARLLFQLENLTVHARAAGIVQHRLGLGQESRTAQSVASIAPAYASEIVAYATEDLPLDALEAGVVAQVRGGERCSGKSAMLRRGSRVVQAPGQLRELYALPVYGLPLYLALPEGCELGIGEIVRVQLSRRDEPLAASATAADTRAADARAAGAGEVAPTSG